MHLEGAERKFFQALFLGKGKPQLQATRWTFWHKLNSRNRRQNTPYVAFKYDHPVQGGANKTCPLLKWSRTGTIEASRFKNQQMKVQSKPFPKMYGFMSMVAMEWLSWPIEKIIPKEVVKWQACIAARRIEGRPAVWGQTACHFTTFFWVWFFQLAMTAIPWHRWT